MNRVFVDGEELFNVTVVINDGEATVTPNAPGTPSHGGGVTPNSGGGPGEEQPPKKT